MTVNREEPPQWRTDGRDRETLLEGVELIRPDVAVLRLRAGQSVPRLPLRVMVPRTDRAGGPSHAVEVREILRAQDEPVVALILAAREPTPDREAVPLTLPGWFCRMFPRLCL